MKINIKFISIFSILTIGLILSSNMANASNEKTFEYKNKAFIGGSLKFLNTSSELEEPSGVNIINNIDISKSTTAFGINAGYKIYLSKNSKNSLFITPEIGYNFGSTEGEDEIYFGSNAYSLFMLEITPTWEAKISLGYEFNNKHSIFAGVGVKNIDYKYDYTFSNNTLIHTEIKEDNEIAFTLSIGYSYNIGKNFSISFIYEGTEIDITTPNKDLMLAGKVLDKVNTSINNFQIGINYLF